MEQYEDCEHDIVDKTCIKCGLMIESCIDEKLDYTKNCPQISSGKNNILDNHFDSIKRPKLFNI